MVSQPTSLSQQYTLLHDNSKLLPSNNSPSIPPAFDVSLSARHYVISGYLLAVAQRLSLKFIFKALVGMVEICNFDFLQSQSVSTMQQHIIDLFTPELAAKGFELLQLRALFLLS
jgi:hypothetical protein